MAGNDYLSRLPIINVTFKVVRAAAVAGVDWSLCFATVEDLNAIEAIRLRYG